MIFQKNFGMDKARSLPEASKNQRVLDFVDGSQLRDPVNPGVNFKVQLLSASITSHILFKIVPVSFIDSLPLWSRVQVPKYRVIWNTVNRISFYDYKWPLRK